ncbi:MAG: PAS domain S-box protein [Bacteroidales bacterium]|nr:PAS domain S-box protein [Bacteroidales bacterium]
MSKPNSSQIISQLKEILPELFSTNGSFDKQKFFELMNDENQNKESYQPASGTDLSINIFEESPLPMYIFDCETYKFLKVNQAAIALYGYTELEFLSLTVKDIRPIEEIPSLLENVKSAKSKAEIPTIIKHFKKNGELLHVKITYLKLNYHGYNARLVIVKNITDVVEMQKSLAQREFWLSETQKAGKIGSFSFNYEKGYWKSSELLDSIFGIPNTEKKDIETWISLIHPKDKDELVHYFEKLILDHSNKYDKEYRILRPDGRTIWVWGLGNITYNSKGDLVKMMGTIQDITNKKLAETEKAHLQTNFETFFNTIDDFLFVLDEQGRIIHTNKTVESRLNYAAEELFGQPVLMVHPEEQREEASQIVMQMLQGKAEVCPIPIQTKSGIQIPVETRIKKGEWNGKPALFGVTKDISKIKLSEEKFSKAFHINPSACGLSDLATKVYTEVNDAFCELFGFTKEEVLGKTALDLGIMTEESRNKVLHQADINGKITNIETSLKTKSGEIRHIILSAENIQIQDKTFRFTVATDITERVESAKKLKESEERYRLINDNMTDVIWTMNLEGNFTYFSPSIEKLTEYTPAELKGANATLHLTPFSAQKANSLFSTLIAQIKEGITPESQKARFQFITKDNRTIWIESIIDFIWDEKNQQSYFVGVTRNIDDRKKIELTLQASRSKYRSIFRNSPIGIISYDENGVITTCNEAFIQIIGSSRTALIGLDMKKLPNKELVAALQTSFEGTIGHYEGEYQSVTANKKTLIKSTFAPVTDNNMKVVGGVGLIEDITNRKQAEKELRDNRELLLTLMNASPDFISLKDESDRLQVANQTSKDLFHLNDIDFIGKTDEEIGQINTAYSRNWSENCKNSDNQAWMEKKQIHVEELHIKPDGSEGIYDVVKVPLYHNNGDRKGLVVIGRDITERKQSEQKLQESEEKFRLLAENTSDIIWTLDINGNYTFTSPSIHKFLGYTDTETLNQTYLTTVHPNSHETASQVFLLNHNLITKGIKPETQKLQLQLTKKDGTPVWVEIVVDFVYDNESNFKYILGITRDIDEQKKADDRIKISEERLHTLINSTPDFVCLKDGEGRWQITNQTGVELFNLHAIDYLDKTDMEITALSHSSYKNTHIGCIESDKKAWANKSIYHVEEIIHKPDGKDVILDVVKVPLFFDDGSRKGLVIIGRDITKRKRVEIALMESETQLKNIINASPIPMAMNDSELNITFINQAFIATFGYQIDEIPTVSDWWPKAYPDPNYGEHVRAQWLEELNRSKKTKTSFKPLNVIVTCKDGSKKEIMVSATTIGNTSNDIDLIVLYDITDMKEAEKAVRESEQKLSMLIDNLPGYVYRCNNDRNWSMIYISSGCFDITGYQPEEFFGDNPMSFNDMIKPQYRQEIWDECQIDIKLFRFFEKEYEITRKDGATRWIWERARGIYDDNNNLLYIEGFITDITVSKKIKKELEVKINELMQFQRVTVGRELAMIELKKEINKLSSDLGLEMPYTIIG